MRSVNRQRAAVAGWAVLVGVDWIYADVATRLLADATGSDSFATVVALLGRAGLWVVLAGRCRALLVRLVMSGRLSSVGMPRPVQAGKGSAVRALSGASAAVSVVTNGGGAV